MFSAIVGQLFHHFFASIFAYFLIPCCLVVDIWSETFRVYRALYDTQIDVGFFIVLSKLGEFRAFTGHRGSYPIPFLDLP